MIIEILFLVLHKIAPLSWVLIVLVLKISCTQFGFGLRSSDIFYSNAADKRLLLETLEHLIKICNICIYMIVFCCFVLGGRGWYFIFVIAIYCLNWFSYNILSLTFIWQQMPYIWQITYETFPCDFYNGLTIADVGSENLYFTGAYVLGWWLKMSVNVLRLRTYRNIKTWNDRKALLKKTWLKHFIFGINLCWYVKDFEIIKQSIVLWWWMLV